MSREESLTESILSHAKLLNKIALKLTRDEHDADDLTQETLYRALKYREKFQPETNLKAWLIKILHNTHINQLTKSKRHSANRAAMDFMDLDDSALQASIALECSNRNDAMTPETAFFSRRIDKAILNEILNLPKNFRSVFVLSQFMGMPYDQVSTLCDVSVGTIKSRVFRAKKILMRRLDSYAASIGFRTGLRDEVAGFPMNDRLQNHAGPDPILDSIEASQPI